MDINGFTRSTTDQRDRVRRDRYREGQALVVDVDQG